MEGSFIQTTIVDFAKFKLLAGSDTIEKNRNGSPSGPLDRALACFSMRFPLECNFAYRDTRAIVGNQIESHMRLCTVVTNGFELLLTTVGSEPLLAEAAAQAMGASKMSPVKLLSTYMDTNCVSVGERGELVAALLVMRARDVLAASTSERWVRVIDFMENLIACPELRTALPRYAQADKAELQFQGAFEESRIWMNHVLKVRDADLINVNYL